MGPAVVIAVVVLLLKATVVTPLQHEWVMEVEEASVDEYSKNYFETPRLSIFWINKTMQALNDSLNVKRDLGETARMNVTIFKAVRNIWMSFPLDRSYDFYKNPCLMLKMNMFGCQRIAKQYFNRTRCPLPRGRYQVSNFLLDWSVLPPKPPVVPYGRYKVIANLYDKNSLIGAIHAVGELKPLREH